MKIIKVESCGECPNYVRGPSHTPDSGGCKHSWIWFGTNVDTSIIPLTCRLTDYFLDENYEQHKYSIEEAVAIVGTKSEVGTIQWNIAMNIIRNELKEKK